VIRGIVRTCRFHSDGHRRLTGFCYAGDVFGAEPGMIHTEAVTDALVLRHNRDADSDSQVEDSIARADALQRALGFEAAGGMPDMVARPALGAILQQKRATAGGSSHIGK
jgi:hypothetical protein